MTVKKDQDILSKKIIEFFIQSAKNNIDFDTFKQYSLDFQKEIYGIISKHEFIIKKYYNKIITWLNSKEFQEYSNNKPFPCLFPLKHINYDEIDAELAWYLNIPIKDNYDIVWLQKASSGTDVTTFFFDICDISYNHIEWTRSSAEDFKNFFDFFKEKKDICVIKHTREDFCYFINKNINMFFMVRDPIEILRSNLNHLSMNHYNITPNMKRINLKSDYKKLFPKIIYHHSQTTKPDISGLKKIIQAHNGNFFNTNRKIQILQPFLKDINCIEFSQINTTNGFETFKKLAKEYNLKQPINPEPFKQKINRMAGDLLVLSVVFYVNKNDLNPLSNVNSFKSKESLKIVITTHYLSPDTKNYIDITNEIFTGRKLLFNNIIFLIKSNEYEILKKDQELFLASKKFLNGYMNALETHEQKIKNNLITEEQILDYLKDKKELRNKLKKLIDEDLTYVKKYHPEYLQKWRYYQKFKEICEK
ncbi:DUF2972 domain-containing protein [Campylobacter lari]|uniref:Putative invasion protein n=1 Tax=Campylobacter lari NCTC 11845 TaxID=1388749 RepID=A0A0A8HXR1_CAMLA|nr:DUF2972 domain-containing protein [Campylobacter lari]AJD02236.1 putative invasion protein [Campylobacter lari NCTC 11845]EAK9954111.1 DUF2972 domain-containing protein [Campylobacter lari]